MPAHQLVYCIPTDLKLSDTERSVLSKGLKFIPLKPSVNKYDIIHSCQRFFRSLRWMAVLGHPPKQQTSLNNDIFTRLFHKAIGREPPHGTFAEVECYIHKCLTELRNLKFKPLKSSNLTPAESKALQSLQKRDDIVIKPADKGGAVVVWDRSLYIDEAYRQLNSSLHYQHLDKPALPAQQKEITKTIKDMISTNQLPSTAKLLIKNQPKQPSFYLLPKIHKTNNPGRPIVSACSCPTEHISHYLDVILQPLVHSLPTFIKDSTHALNLIERLNADCNFQPKYLFTMDVTSLYTCIPHADGLQALTYFLNKRPTKNPPTATLIRLAELVLNMNTFSFNGEIFSQMSGVAMGTKMGPSYACLFMGYFEHQLMQSYTKPIPEIYKRYIDDGVGATSLNYNQLLDFIKFVQNFHPAVKFTYEISDVSVVFLDMTISLHEGKLSTSVHYKPTDSHSYLDYRSSHHPAMKNSIPFSQFLRLRRLCSDDVDFDLKAAEMREFFHQRHYPTDVINSALSKVKQIPRTQTLQPTTTSAAEERPILSLLYHPAVHRVRKILLSNWNILHSRAEVAEIFDQPPLIAYKRDTNIRDTLVRSKLQESTQRTPGTSPCNKPKCQTCPFICRTTDVQGPKSEFTITKQFNCLTYNIVYVIHCTKCGKLYIGETGRTLNTRFKEHLADIRHRRDKPVANHFNTADHSIYHVRVKGLWLMFSDNSQDRKDMESHLIDRLGSRKPDGMNEKP